MSNAGRVLFAVAAVRDVLAGMSSVSRTARGHPLGTTRLWRGEDRRRSGRSLQLFAHENRAGGKQRQGSEANANVADGGRRNPTALRQLRALGIDQTDSRRAQRPAEDAGTSALIAIGHAEVVGRVVWITGLRNHIHHTASRCERARRVCRARWIGAVDETVAIVIKPVSARRLRRWGSGERHNFARENDGSAHRHDQRGNPNRRNELSHRGLYAKTWAGLRGKRERRSTCSPHMPNVRPLNCGRACPPTLYRSLPFGVRLRIDTMVRASVYGSGDATPPREPQPSR